MALEQQTALVDGLKVNYWVGGQDQGRTLLLLHGGTGDAHLHWHVAMPMLSDTFRVIAPDLPGYGRSQVLPRMRVDSVLHWIKAFLDELKIDPAVMVGNSMGGLLARLFAAANPQYVPALILVNGGGVPEMPAFMRGIERIPGLSSGVFGLIGRMATSPDTLKRMIYIQEIITDDFVQQAQAAGPSFARLMRVFVRGVGGQPSTPMVPTLILWGANDQIATVSDAKAIKDSIPGATLTEITDCGHMPQLETPDVFVWQVSTFLDKLSRPRSTNLPGAGMLSDPSA